ncbi:MAG: Hsp33 family molecular chaperone HslO [Acidobacteriota bacterium]
MSEPSPAGELRVGTAAAGQLRYVGCELTSVLDHARLILDLGPLATIALGRGLAATAMLTRLVTKRPRRLSLDFKGSGPLDRVLAECDAKGRLRGIVGAKHATGVRGASDLQVGPALGVGLLIVQRIEEQGQVYESRVVLHDGEIGTDVAHYLDQSEQRRSAVLVGADLRAEGVQGAGGLIVEALPAADPELVEDLESRLGAISSPSRRISEAGLGGLVDDVLGTLSPSELERAPLVYDCGCSRESLLGSLGSLPEKELRELTASDGTLDAECSYCGRTFRMALREILGPSPN